MTELEEDILLDDELLEEQPEEHEHWRIEVDKGQNPVRVDKFLMDHMPGTSRNRIQKAAEAGSIRANDKPIKNNYKVKAGDIITLVLDHPKRDWEIVPEDLPLDVVYEDEVLLVINKPAGLVVHPGCGNYSGTLVNALAWHLRDDKGFDPNDPTVGLVHRIDKDTSGLLVIAKTAEAKTDLCKQFFYHTTRREYNALVWGPFADDEGTITGNIGRHAKDRLQMDVYPMDGEIGKPAITHYKVLERFGPVTLVEAIRSLLTNVTAVAKSCGASRRLPTKHSSTTALPCAHDKRFMQRLWASSIPRRTRRCSSPPSCPRTSKLC